MLLIFQIQMNTIRVNVLIEPIIELSLSDFIEKVSLWIKVSGLNVPKCFIIIISIGHWNSVRTCRSVYNNLTNNFRTACLSVCYAEKYWKQERGVR